MTEHQAQRPEPAVYEVGGELPDAHVIDDIAAAVEASDRLRTGDPHIDAVIDHVATIGDRPLPEQPAAFDDAHERLRRTLDSPSGDA